MDRLLPRNGLVSLNGSPPNQEKQPMTSDHGQTAQTFASIGIDIRQGCIPHRRLRCRRQGRPAQEVQAISAGERTRQAAAEHRRARGMPQRPLRQPHAAPARAHAAHHPGDLRQAVHQGPEERLHFKGHPRIATSVGPRMSEGVEIYFVAFDADGFQEARKMLSEAIG